MIDSEKSDMEKISRELAARDRSDKSNYHGTVTTGAGGGDDATSGRRSPSSLHRSDKNKSDKSTDYGGK